MGVLQDAVAFRAHDPVINAIFMELAFLFAPKGAELSAMHVWSENNTLADTQPSRRRCCAAAAAC